MELLQANARKARFLLRDAGEQAAHTCEEAFNLARLASWKSNRGLVRDFKPKKRTLSEVVMSVNLVSPNCGQVGSSGYLCPSSLVVGQTLKSSQTDANWISDIGSCTSTGCGNQTL